MGEQENESVSSSGMHRHKMNPKFKKPSTKFSAKSILELKVANLNNCDKNNEDNQKETNKRGEKHITLSSVDQSSSRASVSINEGSLKGEQSSQMSKKEKS